LKEQDAILIELDKEGKVFFTVTTQKIDQETNDLKRAVVNHVNASRSLGLTSAEVMDLSRIRRLAYHLPG
jgi:hypothetical protein